MKFTYTVLLILVTLVFSACMDDKKKDSPEVKTVDTSPVKKVHNSAPIDASFSDDQTAAIFKNYIQLKTALVNTDSESVKAAAFDLMTVFANKSVDDVLMKAAENIQTSDDIEVQRMNFVDITAGVEALLADAIQEGTVYKQYCPMAFNNTGASWLSESKEIQNPYFGDKMLKCGRIDAELK